MRPPSPSRFTDSSLRSSQLHGDEKITTMSFDWSMRRLITGAHDGSVRMWNFSNGMMLKEQTLKEQILAECVAGREKVKVFDPDRGHFCIFKIPNRGATMMKEEEVAEMEEEEVAEMKGGGGGGGPPPCANGAKVNLRIKGAPKGAASCAYKIVK